MTELFWPDCIKSSLWLKTIAKMFLGFIYILNDQYFKKGQLNRPINSLIDS